MRALLLLLCLLCGSCSVLTPEQRQAAVQVLHDELAQGNISQAQHDAAVEALARDEPYDWSGLGFAAINAILALIGGPILVRRLRGPPTQKVGLPAALVRSE